MTFIVQFVGDKTDFKVLSVLLVCHWWLLHMRSRGVLLPVICYRNPVQWIENCNLVRTAVIKMNAFCIRWRKMRNLLSGLKVWVLSINLSKTLLMPGIKIWKLQIQGLRSFIVLNNLQITSSLWTKDRSCIRQHSKDICIFLKLLCSSPSTRIGI